VIREPLCLTLFGVGFGRAGRQRVNFSHFLVGRGFLWSEPGSLLQISKRLCVLLRLLAILRQCKSSTLKQLRDSSILGVQFMGVV